nr:unconventional myosin-XVIIIa isoform X4 [Onthophagus taurus]
MPLNPSSYSKIFKSKYVQDDDDEENNQNLNTNEENDLEGTSSSSFVPSYSNPKVQELLSKPRPDFDKIFSSRYLQDDLKSTKTPSFRSSSVGFETKPRNTNITSNLPPPKDYDKIFTSRYLNDDYQPLKNTRKSVNPYLSDEDDADNNEISIKHLPPSRGGSIRRSVPPINRLKYNESYPTKQFDLKPTYEDDFESKPLRKIYSRSVTPSIRSESSYLRSETPSKSSYKNFSLDDKDDSSVVLDANLTFILGCKSKLKQNVKAVPAFKETDTKSNALSSKIADFLTRTDHVMEEWGEMGKNRKRKCGDKSMSINGKSKSATNIMIKGFQLYSKANSVDRGMSSRCGDDDENTQYEIDELSEMTVDLAEEHSTSTLAAERLDVETAERIRLERELTDVQQKNKNLQSASEKLEMELLYARSDLNHHQQTSDDDEEDGENEPVYKQRYERVVRELEFTKRRLRQQHEDDLEQLVGLKKQLEKKLTDAYEEVEEQRQVVGQWKRKVQKLTSEMGDIKLLLEEQISRNNILEKKQRKFDSEIQNVQEELKKERQSKDRLSREKEILTAEKFGMEGTVGDLRMELDMKEEKLHALQKELDELTFGGKTEEEVAILRKQKIDCERRLHDQEEELDELAGQVQLLEQAKLKLEMSLEQQRKAAKKEAQQHEEELEEVRCNAQKKVKALEAQLENEHEERTVLLREKHELERRLASALENDRNDKAVDEAVVQRLKRDLKRTKALLRDTQMQLDRQRAENPSKTLIRQLRNQIEDLECARTTALKTKQTLETDLSEIQSQLEETTRIKCDLEEKYNSNLREKSDLQNQVEENEEELAEVLKKYKTTVQQMSLDQIALQEQVALVAELETEKAALKEQLAEMSSRLETVENMGDASSNVLVRKNEMKVKELEHKLDLEQTTRQRLEVQISRLKEAVEKLQNEIGVMRNKEQTGQELIRKLQRQIRELRDEHNTALTKEGESILKRKEIEKRYEALEAETTTVRGDLRLALKRIEDLQAVIQNDLEDSSEQSDSEIDSLSSEDSVNSFLKHHKLSVKPSNMQIESTKPRSTSVNSIKDTSYA